MLVRALLILMLPLLVMLNGGILPVVLLILRGYDYLVERKLINSISRRRGRLKDRGRFLKASEFLTRVNAGGTLISECRYSAALLGTGERETFWWTDDDIQASAPFQIPGGARQLEEQLGYPNQDYDQFVRQVANRYIDDEDGKACIVELPTYVPDTFHNPEWISLLDDGVTRALYSRGRHLPPNVVVINTQDHRRKPGASNVEVTEEENSRSMLIPPLGLRFFKRELRTLCINTLVSFWIVISCGAVALWCFPKKTEFASLHGFIDVFWISISFVLGLGCVVGLVNIGFHVMRGWQLIEIAHCRSKLVAINNTLSIFESGPIRSRESTYPLSDIATVGVCLNDDGYCFTDVMVEWSRLRGLDVDCPAVSRLLIHCHDALTAVFLVGRDPKELQWIATVLRHWLNHK